MQSRHAPWEPHTNWGGIFLCILPFLNTSDFLWLRDVQFLIPCSLFHSALLGHRVYKSDVNLMDVLQILLINLITTHNCVGFLVNNPVVCKCYRNNHTMEVLNDFLISSIASY